VHFAKFAASSPIYTLGAPTFAKPYGDIENPRVDFFADNNTYKKSP